MKVSKLQASDNRDAIVQAASAQIRRRGFAKTSVADVAKAAGLTHGALYSHFETKEALQTQAMQRAFTDCGAGFSGLTAEQFLKCYLSEQHRDNPEDGCPTAALVSEVHRQSDECKTVFRDGLDQFTTLVGNSLQLTSGRKDPDPDKTLLMFAAMVGGLAMSRAIRDIDKTASNDILRVVSTQLQRLVVEPASTPKSSKVTRPAR